MRKSLQNTKRKMPIEWRKKIGLANKGKNNFFYGKKLSAEHKRKISVSSFGKKHSESTKKKLSVWNIKHPNRKFKDTYIEIKIETELKKRGIAFSKQVPLCRVAVVDFYIPELRTVIQCDGCFWHNCPIHFPKVHSENSMRDAGQDAVLESNGFRVFRFWEHEINKSAKNCINKLLKK